MTNVRNIITILLFGIFTYTSPGMAAVLRGQVIDSATGNPIEGASVLEVKSGLGTATGFDGKFLIDGVESGRSHSVSITRLNYLPLELLIEADAHSNLIELNFVGIERGEVTILAAKRGLGVTSGSVSSISSESVKRGNTVVEPPQLAMHIPNATFYSWGGLMLGATSLKLRGFDSNRLTVSVNGIPINDPEDHSVYWQDTPDFLSNTHDMQVERGVSSFLTAPAGIGGGLNLSTSDVVATRQTELGLYWGDYNTQRRTFLYRSGLVNEKYNFTGRFSRASTDGYRDHSAVDEWSYFLAATRFDEHSVHTLNVYGGQEVSDLSYTAIERSILDTNRTWTPEANHDVGWDGERDDFQQPHYILRSKWRATPTIEVEEALYWIEGKGFYEQYRAGRDLEEYGLKYVDTDDDGDLDTMQFDETDLIRRKHVDKAHFGWLPKVHWKISEATEFNGGLELRFYTSDHTNRVMWARNIPNGVSPQHAYNTWDMTKDYLGVSGNINHKMSSNLEVNGGAEFRQIKQKVNQDKMGLYQGYSFERTWTFVNPRVGFNYLMNDRTNLYASLAMAGREPFEAQELNPDNPRDTVKVVDPESMTDLELGVRHRLGSIEVGANVYAMFFTNEIVYTGRWDTGIEELELANAPTSRHLGLEVDAVWTTPLEGLNISGDIGIDHSTFGAFMFNYINEILADWSPVEKSADVEGNPIPMTPNYVLNLRGNFVSGGFETELGLHSVGRQYLDPLGDEEWSLEPYSLLNASLGYRFAALGLGWKVSCNAVNLLDMEYDGYGWTETVWPESEVPATGRYMPKFIPAVGRMIVGGVTIEL